MPLYADKNKEPQSKGAKQRLKKQLNEHRSTPEFVDNRPSAIANRKLQEEIDNSPRAKQLKAFQEMANNGPKGKQGAQLREMTMNRTKATLQRMQHPEEEEKEPLQKKANPVEEKEHTAANPIQRKENNTGLSDSLKSGIENLSGYAMDDVKVHYNSGKPAQLNAHAYAQGTDIHLAPGQEKHLPHEAWHVVQQKQGRVKPTMQLKDKININDDAGLEQEADVMGQKALQLVPESYPDNALSAKTRYRAVTIGQRSVIQANNAVRDAFLSGSKVIMAGEHHGEFKKSEEREAWEEYGVKVVYEAEKMQIPGESGTVKEIRLDSPYMGMIHSAEDVYKTLSGNVYEWAYDKNSKNQKMLFDEIELLYEVMEMEFKSLIDELKQEGKDDKDPKFKKAMLLMEFVKTIYMACKSYFEMNGFQRQLKGGELLNDISININLLENEIKSALPLEGLDSGLAGHAAMARSIIMVQRLQTWAPHVPNHTIWKVGEQHIIDAVKIINEGIVPPANTTIMDRATYKPAFMAVLQVRRSRETEKFISGLNERLGEMDQT